MTVWQGYKGGRKGAAERLNDERLKQAAQLDVPLLWLLSWNVQLTAAQKYKIQRGLL